MPNLFEPLTFARGAAMANRFMLAPLTNSQSHADGTLSDEEIAWLALRAGGGFGAVMTAAAFVDPAGKGFPGQLGAHDDACLPGLTRLAETLRAEGVTPILQLYHAGLRSITEETGLPRVGPSDDAATGAREMTTAEVEALIEHFIAGAVRARQAGFDTVEIHGAHGYLLCSFLAASENRRTDRFGGSLENRARPIREIIAGIRTRCGPDFGIGLRLSAERMGMLLGEIRELCQQLMHEDQLDFIDLSLWDVFKEPVEEEFKGKPLIAWFAGLDRGRTRLGVAGNIRSGPSAQACLDAGADFVLIGRAAIIDHDFPARVRRDPDYAMPALPIARERLDGQGLSPVFLEYIATFPGFLQPV